MNLSEMSSPASLFTACVSVSASIMLFQTMLNRVFPEEVKNYIFARITSYFRPLPSTITLIIEERDGMASNEVYNAAEIYLCNKIINPDIQYFKVSKCSKEPNIRVKFAKCGKIVDFFQGIELIWRFVSEDSKNIPDVDSDNNNIVVSQEKRCFELSFHKKHKNEVLNFYMPFLLKEAKIIRDEKKVVKLYTLACSSSYSSIFYRDFINLEHPSTFDTLAMDLELKKAIIEDLDRFLKRREFYKKVGKAWKRGYLIYGPPGTGKSSLIVAMANYLKFDVYDLELSSVKRDSDLRRLLLRTTNRSILVVEDIDCSIELVDRRTANHGIHADFFPRDQKITLSGLLNFIDGLWSSCGDERIIIFTTNNKDTLDPALLRPGRMDMHIHMSYLTIQGFKVLAENYLQVQYDYNNRVFREVQDLIEEVQVTPAEVAEELMKSDDVDASLGELARFLKRKMIKNEEKGIEIHKTKKMKSCDHSKMNLEGGLEATVKLSSCDL
ncbi:AAA-ATPase At3g50940-like [Nicotiana tomentosiformis]|uniref:AAA-ATPase At3g50940-like n=1 Tax=Nicotiana tomentosiformis TaxID=4098 RepID=UPI00051C1189|nr:AAA-ATPase At3g50940-like [Nicotiana tomentosiformis]